MKIIKYSCYKCRNVNSLDIKDKVKRDPKDQLDVWKCKSCKASFKLDVRDYMENRNKKNYIHKTFSSRKKILDEASLNYQEGQEPQEKRGFVDKWWWAILIIVFVFAFYDDFINGRMF